MERSVNMRHPLSLRCQWLLARREWKKSLTRTLWLPLSPRQVTRLLCMVRNMRVQVIVPMDGTLKANEVDLSVSS